MNSDRVNFEPGSELAHYKILYLLAKGGMGEVYLAQDKLLERQIALKILPEQFIADSQRVRRFEREARAASALNHPNIVTVYEIGQADNLQYIATEYVDGDTLRHRIAETRSLGEVLEVARQVASALVAAHEAGITHRDVKPENIMLRRDGFVKVLDFGLAKLSTTPAAVVQSDIPTRAVIRTDPGIVMGTVQYMSPEQARGLKVDQRTDIWSLGVVLYEMLTGRPPFEGETSSHVIVSILEKEPAPLAQFVEAPAELQRLIDKTLRKNRDERYQTAKDLELDLNNLKHELEIEAHLKRYAHVQTPERQSSDPTTVPTEYVDKVRTTSSVEYLVTEIGKHKRGVILAAAMIVLLLVGVSYGLYAFLSKPKDPAIPFQRTKMVGLTTTGKVKDAAISPDGKYVAYVEAVNRQHSLWIKHLPTGTTVPITPPAPRLFYWGLTFSNDSNRIYFVTSQSYEKWKLYEVGVLGGIPKQLLEHIDSAVTFSPDGKRFAFIRGYYEKGEMQLVVANTDGTQQQILATRKKPDYFYAFGTVRPAWSPDGKLIAVPAGGKDATGWYQNVVGVDVENGSERSLTNQRWYQIFQVAWLANGNGFAMIGLDAEESSRFLQPQLWHVSYPSGEAHRITNDLNAYNSLSLAADSRTLITTQSNLVSNIWLAPRGDTGRAKQLTSGTNDGTFGLTWTADGKIVYRSMASGTSDLWMMNADGSNQKRLTHEGYNATPVLSNDGRYIFFTSYRAGNEAVWRMDVDGGNEKRLTKQGRYPVVAADAPWVFYSMTDPAQWTFAKVPFDGGEPIEVPAPPGSNSIFIMSPDGKQAAVLYWDGQANPPGGVAIFPIAGGPPTKRLEILVDGEGLAWGLYWAADGRAIIYLDENRANIWSQPIDGSKPTRLTDFQGDEIFSFAYSPDGKWLAVSRGRETEDVMMITDLK